MKNDCIETKVEMSLDDQQKMESIIHRIEDASPSDASVFFKLDKVEDKYVGSLKIKSQYLQVDLAEEDFDMDTLLDVLNVGCREQINDWKRKRNF